jgi:hypothetical protein
MVEKPISGDEEQRRAQTRAARFQSGLPPEELDTEPADKSSLGSEKQEEQERDGEDVA